MDAVTDPNILAQLNAPDASPAPAASAGGMQPVTDTQTLSALGGNDAPGAAPAAGGAEMRSYSPTWREQLGSWLAEKIGGDHPSPEVDRLVTGLVGSTGLGDTRINVADLTGAGAPMLAQEATREAQAGNYGRAALDAVGAIPAPILNKGIGAVVDGAGAAASAIANLRPGATGPVAEAADRLGVNIPTVATYGDGTVGSNAQNLAGKMASIPFVGTPITKATNASLDDLGSAADAVTSKYLQKPGTAPPPISDAAPAPVGDTVKQALGDWIGGKGPTDSPAILKNLYDSVDSFIPKNHVSGLPETTKAVQQLLAKDSASATNVSAPAINMVAEAINTPGGLTYNGMKDLRTAVGAKLDDGLLPDAGTVKPALKQIYAGLSKDLDATVAGLGGHQASAAWSHAETVANDFAARRDDLTKIIGSDGGMNSEGVVDRLVRYAGSQSTADLHKLALARNTLGGSWDDVSAAAIQRLGRNQANEFDLGQFTKHYEALSPNGRNMLFASTSKASLKNDLDDLSTLGTKFKQLQSYLNHSGTGGTTAVLGALGGIASGGLHGLGVVLAAAVGGNRVAAWLARPANLKQTVQFGNALYHSATSGAGGQMAQAALVRLASHIANETGEDPNTVNARMTAAMQGGGQ